jgi:hypothetical protein
VKLLLDTFLIDAKYDAVTQEGGDFVYKLGGEGLLQWTVKLVLARTRRLQHDTVRRVGWTHAAGEELGTEHAQMLRDSHHLRLSEKMIDAGRPMATSDETHRRVLDEL